MKETIDGRAGPYAIGERAATPVSLALRQNDGGEFENRGPMVDGAQSAMRMAAFVNAVERLERILDAETDMLNRNKPIALQDFNHRKSHGLLELSRAMSACRANDRSIFDFEARAPLGRLRGKLESNLSSLKTHLAAVSEIAAIIARAIQDHESDGTYTARRHTRDA